MKRAYDAGELGTAKQLAAKWFKGIPKAAYLNADGTLKPLSSIHGNAHLAFDAWLHDYVGTLQNKVGRDVNAAWEHVRQRSINTGKPCKQVIASS